ARARAGTKQPHPALRQPGQRARAGAARGGGRTAAGHCRRGAEPKPGRSPSSGASREPPYSRGAEQRVAEQRAKQPWQSWEFPFCTGSRGGWRPLRLQAVEKKVEVGPENCRSVQRLVIVPAERLLPQDSEQERADHAEDDMIDVHGTELALL